MTGGRGGGGSGKEDGSELGVGYLEWRLRDTEIPHRVVVGRVWRQTPGLQGCGDTSE